MTTSDAIALLERFEPARALELVRELGEAAGVGACTGEWERYSEAEAAIARAAARARPRRRDRRGAKV